MITLSESALKQFGKDAALAALTEFDKRTGKKGTKSAGAGTGGAKKPPTAYNEFTAAVATLFPEEFEEACPLTFRKKNGELGRDPTLLMKFAGPKWKENGEIVKQFKLDLLTRTPTVATAAPASNSSSSNSSAAASVSDSSSTGSAKSTESGVRKAQLTAIRDLLTKYTVSWDMSESLEDLQAKRDKYQADKKTSERTAAEVTRLSTKLTKLSVAHTVPDHSADTLVALKAILATHEADQAAAAVRAAALKEQTRTATKHNANVLEHWQWLAGRGFYTDGMSLAAMVAERDEHKRSKTKQAVSAEPPASVLALYMPIPESEPAPAPVASAAAATVTVTATAGPKMPVHPPSSNSVSSASASASVTAPPPGIYSQFSLPVPGSTTGEFRNYLVTDPDPETGAEHVYEMANGVAGACVGTLVEDGDDCSIRPLGV